MTTLAFDTLRYARRLKEAGVPETQAEVQAELMAEAFGFYANNLLTRDHFTEVLNARFAEQDAKVEQRFAEQDARIEQRFAEQDAKFEQRLVEQDAKFEQRFAQQDVKFEARFADQDVRIEQRFAALGANMESRLNRQDRTLILHTFMLGLITVTLVVPQLQAWLG